MAHNSYIFISIWHTQYIPLATEQMNVMNSYKWAFVVAWTMSVTRCPSIIYLCKLGEEDKCVKVLKIKMPSLELRLIKCMCHTDNWKLTINSLLEKPQGPEGSSSLLVDQRLAHDQQETSQGGKEVTNPLKINYLTLYRCYTWEICADVPPQKQLSFSSFLTPP